MDLGRLKGILGHHSLRLEKEAFLGDVAALTCRNGMVLITTIPFLDGAAFSFKGCYWHWKKVKWKGGADLQTTTALFLWFQEHMDVKIKPVLESSTQVHLFKRTHVTYSPPAYSSTLSWWPCPWTWRPVEALPLPVQAQLCSSLFLPGDLSRLNVYSNSLESVNNGLCCENLWRPNIKDGLKSPALCELCLRCYGLTLGPGEKTQRSWWSREWWLSGNKCAGRASWLIFRAAWKVSYLDALFGLLISSCASACYNIHSGLGPSVYWHKSGALGGSEFLERKMGFL